MKAMKLITTLGLATLALVACTDEDEVQEQYTAQRRSTPHCSN